MVFTATAGAMRDRGPGLGALLAGPLRGEGVSAFPPGTRLLRRSRHLRGLVATGRGVPRADQAVLTAKRDGRNQVRRVDEADASASGA